MIMTPSNTDAGRALADDLERELSFALFSPERMGLFKDILAYLRSAPSGEMGRDAVARIIGGNIFGTPDASVGPATKAAREDALKKTDAILALALPKAGEVEWKNRPACSFPGMAALPPSAPVPGEGVRSRCDWPPGEFTFLDEPGAHDPCYVVMPGGAMLELNHHAGEGVDIARAKFIIDACNAALDGGSLLDEVNRWKEVAKTEAQGRERMRDQATELTQRLAAPQPGARDAVGEDQIALDAAHQIEALPSDLGETQKTARIQLIVLSAMEK